MEPKGYTTPNQIENYLLTDIATSFLPQVNDWIIGIEEEIEMITGRIFVADTEATARLYDGDGDKLLIIDDAVEVTLVEIGNDGYGASFSEVASSGADRYFLNPSNHTVKGEPITSIELNSRKFLRGKQNQRITAKWGYSVNVPKAIERAATVFVAGIINQHNQSGDQVKSEKIGDYMVTYNSDKGNDSFSDFEMALKSLDRFKRHRL